MNPNAIIHKADLSMTLGNMEVSVIYTVPRCQIYQKQHIVIDRHICIFHRRYDLEGNVQVH